MGTFGLTRPVMFPARYSRLDPKALADLVEQNWELNDPVSCTFVYCGENDLYRIESGKNTSYLRVYRVRFSDPLRVEPELSVLEEIRTVSDEVSGPIKTKKGKLFLTIQAFEGERMIAFFEAAPGQMLSRSRVEGWDNFGSALARLHLAKVQGIGLPTLTMEEVLQIPLRRWQEQLLALGQEVRELTDLTEQLAHSMAPIWDHLPVGLVHGDTAGGNAHLDASGHLMFFDFMWTGFAPWAWDLGIFRRGAGEIDENWNAFRTGYDQVRIIEPAELAAIPIFAAIRSVFATANVIDEGLIDLQGECSVSWFAGRLNELRRLVAKVSEPLPTATKGVCNSE